MSVAVAAPFSESNQLQITSPAMPPASEASPQAVVDAFSALTIAQKVIRDDRGQVVELALSNHTGTGFWKGGTNAPPSGVDDALFQQVLKLSELRAIALETQPLSNQGYALLGQLKKLTDVRLHYIGKNAPSGNPPDQDAPLFINQLPLPLEVLEIKHCFAIKGGCMEKLKPQPALRKLEIDTGYAGRSAVDFITNSPKLVNLQIHRTTMTDGDLQTIFAALPNLEILLIRPSGQKKIADRITGRSLRGLAQCPKLRLLILGMEWGELPYDGGLDALAELSKLEKVQFNASDLKDFSVEDPAIRKLPQARPDLEIRIGTQKLGGVEGRTTEQEDADWNWDGGVTTHG